MKFTAKEISLELSEALNPNFLIAGVVIIVVVTVVVIARYLTNKKRHE